MLTVLLALASIQFGYREPKNNIPSPFISRAADLPGSLNSR